MDSNYQGIVVILIVLIIVLIYYYYPVDQKKKETPTESKKEPTPPPVSPIIPPIIPAPAPAPAPVVPIYVQPASDLSDANYQYIPDSDMMGADITGQSGIDVPDFDTAKRICLTMPGCVAFGYRVADKKAWYKNAIIEAKPHTGFHTFVRKFSTPQPDADFDVIANSDMMGADIQGKSGIPVGSYAEAKKMCLDDPACVAFGYSDTYNKVWLKNGIIETKPHTGFHMFVRKLHHPPILPPHGFHPILL